jgi:hypothetical protein
MSTASVLDEVLPTLVHFVAANVASPGHAWLWWRDDIGDVEASVLASNPGAVLHLDAEQASAFRQAVVEKLYDSGGPPRPEPEPPLARAECLCRAVADAIREALLAWLSSADSLTPMLRAFFEEGVEPRLYVAAAHTPLVLKHLEGGVRRVYAHAVATLAATNRIASMIAALMSHERLRCVTLLQVVLPGLMRFRAWSAPVVAWLQTAVVTATEEQRMTFVEHALAAHQPALMAAVESVMAPPEFERALESAVVAFATGPRGAHPVSLHRDPTLVLLYGAEAALFRRGPCVGVVTPEQVIGALPYLLCAAYDWKAEGYHIVRETMATLTARVVGQLIRRSGATAALLFDAVDLLAMLARTQASFVDRGADDDPFVSVFEDVVRRRRDSWERMDFIGLLVCTENTRACAPGSVMTPMMPEGDAGADAVLAHDLVTLLNDPRMVKGARSDPVRPRRLMCVPAGCVARFLDFAHVDTDAVQREVGFLHSLAKPGAKEYTAVGVLAAAHAAGVCRSDAALLVAAAYHGPRAPVCNALMALPQFRSPAAQALVRSPHFRHARNVDWWRGAQHAV